MILLMNRRAARAFALGVLAIALSAAPASALIPVPFFPPTGNTTGDPDPPEPPEEPIDCEPPPPSDCPPGDVNATPEPGTIVSALVGASLLGGYVMRRNRRK